MYLLNFKSLNIGDIILTKASTIKSAAIRIATLSKFSHAMLYVNYGSIIHAMSDGVHSENVQRILFESENDAICLRIREKTHLTKLSTACNYVRQEIGTAYSIPRGKNRQYCTKLIAKSFEKSGIPLVKRSEYCTPNNLLKSDRLEIIPDVLYKASDNEILFANSPSPILVQKKVTNKIFSYIRTLTKQDIQNEAQIFEFLEANPKYDPDIAKYYLDNGYYDLWKFDLRQNPWRYDPTIFFENIPEKQHVDLATSEITDAQQSIFQFTNNKNTYIDIYNKHGFILSKQHIDLYDTLIELHTKRHDTSFHILDFYKNPFSKNY